MTTWTHINNFYNPLYGKSYEEVLEIIKRDGYNLQYVQQQTPELCTAAVQQSGFALKYVKQQTPEICLAAVQQDGRAIKYVSDEFYDLVK